MNPLALRLLIYRSSLTNLCPLNILRSRSFFSVSSLFTVTVIT